MSHKINFRSALSPLSLEKRSRILSDFFQKAVAEYLAKSPDSIDTKVALGEVNPLWMDVEVLWSVFCSGLLEEHGIMIYPTELSGQMSIEQLSSYLASEVDWPPKPVDSELIYTDIRHWSWSDPKTVPEAKNRSAVFILSPPRSGSTMTRKMLANNPKLFVPAEPNLLMFESMRERRDQLEKLNQHWMRLGPLRIWEQLETAPSKCLNQIESEDTPVDEVYRVIQTHCGDRLLVDKSPMYALSASCLGRAQHLFDQPKYIHLVRHPLGTIESFVRMRFHRLMGDHYGISEANPWRFAEKVWMLCHQNILNLKAATDDGVIFRVYYEELVAKPQQILPELCAFLDVPYDPAMLDPYSGKAAEMLGVGDPNWRLRNRLEPERADVWRSEASDYPLSAPARSLALEFGYAL